MFYNIVDVTDYLAFCRHICGLLQDYFRPTETCSRPIVAGIFTPPTVRRLIILFSLGLLCFCICLRYCGVTIHMPIRGFLQYYFRPNETCNERNLLQAFYTTKNLQSCPVLSLSHFQDIAEVTDHPWNWQAGLWYTFDVTDLLKKQGWDDRNSSLMPSAWKIYLVKW